MNTDSTLAPIALFAFKRPTHLRQTLESLSRNPEFNQSELHIYCDGARRIDEEEAVSQTREVARSWPHAHKTLHEAESNLGLAHSIILGVTILCEQRGHVIVVEDDLTVSPGFLSFLNRALDIYKNESKVMQISAFMFNINLDENIQDSFFLPFTTSWGWATWNRSWQKFDPDMAGYNVIKNNRKFRFDFDLFGAYPYFAMLEKQRVGKIDSWAVRWYLSVFLSGGLILYPRRSLVINEGFDGSGTHCADEQRSSVTPLYLDSLDVKSKNVEIDRAAFEKIIRKIRSDRSFVQQFRDLCRRFIMQ